MANSHETDIGTGQSGGVEGYARRYRPRLGLIEVVLHLWRAKWLMLLVFLPIFGAGLYLATKAPAKYISKAQILLSLDEAYLLRSSVAGAPISVEDIMRIEINLLHSPQVADQVIRRFGLDRLYPDIAALAADSASGRDFAGRGIAALLDDFTVGAVPGQRIIFAEFAHGDDTLATEVLNALMGAYLGYRSDIFEEDAGAPFTNDRERLVLRLAAIDEEMQVFRNDNGLSDFLSERTSLSGFEGSIQAALLEADARLAETTGRIATLKRTLTSVPQTIEVPVEGSATERLGLLEAEREDLLMRYLETSQTVAAVEKQLELLRADAALEAENGDHLREMTNPEYAALSSRISDLEEDARVIRRRRQTLQAQMDRVSNRETELATLEPRWQELQRQRATVEEALSNLATEEFSAKTYIDAVGETGEAVQVIQPARIDRQDLRYRLPVFLLFLLMALIAAFTAGILRALAQQGFVTARSLERSTGLPVVSTVRRQSPAG
ncbi:MAG: Wzz/FepE/Etk N-terminal domain-containing protein [Pseudomonadota bacterium]